MLYYLIIHTNPFRKDSKGTEWACALQNCCEATFLGELGRNLVWFTTKQIYL